MDEERVFVYDPHNTLEDTQRNVLHHQARPKEMSTVLVELPGLSTDTPSPDYHPPSRPRTSTIVNTYHPPETVEDEEKPLEHFVRKNLSTFRRSLTPEDLRSGGKNTSSKEGALLVYPTSTQEINMSLVGNTNQNYSRTLNDTMQNHKELVGNETHSKYMKENVKFKIDDAPNTKEQRRDKSYKNLDEQQYEHELVVMPALEPVSVSQNSPFQRETTLSKSRTSSRVRVMLMVEPSDDEPRVHGKSKNKSNPSHEREGDYSKSRERKEKPDAKAGSKYPNRLGKTHTAMNRRDTMQLSKVKKSKSLEPSDVMKSWAIDPSDERLINYNPRPNSERSAAGGRDYVDHSHGKNQSQDSRDSRRKYEEGPYERSSDRRSSTRSSSRGDRQNSKSKQDDKLFTTQDAPYSVYTVLSNAGQSKKRDNAQGKAERNKDVNRNQNKPFNAAPKYHTVKAPKSATKMVARRRYHIQIPEHGLPETWFNARFNMDNNNNVDMNYEGPVKITNYYTSNNYV